MRILTNVVWTSPTGGVELNVLQVGRELHRRHHSVDLLYQEPGELVEEYDQFCRSLRLVPTMHYWFPKRFRSVVRQGLRQLPAALAAVECRPELIYANQIGSCGWAVPAAGLTRAPLVCHLHDSQDLGPARSSRLTRRIDRLVVVSQFMADRLAALGVDGTRVSVVHNGIDPLSYPPGGVEERSQARRSLGLPEDAFVVTFIGRPDPDKGLHVLLEAWRRLGLGADRGRLLAVGSSVLNYGGDNYITRLAEEADASVEFLPARRDVVTPLHAADVAVVPSVYDEPFGRVVIEGMATSRPVVASAVGGIPEILHGELQPYLFPRGDAAALADRLHSLVGWQGREPNLGERFSARVSAEFTLTQMVDRLEGLFQSLR